MSVYFLQDDQCRSMRKKLQQLEFFSNWIILFYTCASSILITPSADWNQIDLTTLDVTNNAINYDISVSNRDDSLDIFAQFSNPVPFLGKHFILRFFKVSLFTRVLGYAEDFRNAYFKFNGIIPLWLLFHHTGLLVMHTTKVFFLIPDSSIQIILFSLASQSTHNTWTKKYSLIMYWGNVLLGSLTGMCIHFSHERDLTASSCFCYSLLVTVAGILFLILDTISKTKTTPFQFLQVNDLEWKSKTLLPN